MEQAPLSERSHPREFRTHKFVYAVLSRRSHGISIGINLNPDKVCNFDCIYCQVDRTKAPQEHFVGLDQLVSELRTILDGLQPNGWLWNEPEFASIPESKRVVQDMAFSGDGEPTTYKNFDEIVQRCAEVKRELGYGHAKMVLISNATGFERPAVQRGLALMDQNNGEVWGKLDAGTPAYFRLIDNTDFPFETILKNLLACAKVRPLVIQSCFMQVNGVGPSEAEISAYIQRLTTLIKEGGHIARVQIYTVARNPARSFVSSLQDADVDTIARRVSKETGLSAEAFYGHIPEGQGIMDSDRK
jgi:wyosine [tRNA(Phe)-imidazoG37] synthetase (radical SAM superfamily)